MIEQIHIAINRPDGGVSVMALLVVGRGNVLPEGAEWIDTNGWWFRTPTAHIIQTEVMKVQPDAISWRVVEPAELPQERTFRNAWTEREGKFEHDMEKAKNIHRERLRAQRALRLEELDGQWMRATGQGRPQEANAIEAQRQALRDLLADPRIEAAKTIEELKLITVV